MIDIVTWDDEHLASILATSAPRAAATPCADRGLRTPVVSAQRRVIEPATERVIEDEIGGAPEVLAPAYPVQRRSGLVGAGTQNPAPAGRNA